MNDLVAILLFAGSLLATFGLVQLCEWLVPTAPAERGARRFWEPRE
jgi:hypothetical protein